MVVLLLSIQSVFFRGEIKENILWIPPLIWSYVKPICWKEKQKREESHIKITDPEKAFSPKQIVLAFFLLLHDYILWGQQGPHLVTQLAEIP